VTVREALAAGLASFGVRDVFGLVGSGNLELANALVANGVAYHGVNHEAAAVAAADGYARVSGSIGVATVHQGPGFTNTLTALVEALRSRTPLVVLAAESSAGNQVLDQLAVTEAVGGVGMRLREPADLTAAFVRAREHRRTVVLSLPLDRQKAAALAQVPPLPAPPVHPRPSPEDVEWLRRAVAGAERPVILAGRGALHAREALERLAESWGALLATTAAVHGLFTGNLRSVGISGGFASPLARRLLAQADVVLVFGASLNHWTTERGEMFKQARVVQVDLVRPGPVTSTWLQADARATAEALRLTGSGWDASVLAKLRAYRRRDEIDDLSTVEHIDPRTLMVALDEHLPEERAISIDSGHFMGWPAMYLGVRSPDQFVMAQAFQSVGLGLATAIGASVARRDRVTAAVVGDGGLRMSLGELDTAVRLGLPLLVVVVNDAGYGAEVHDFEPLGVDVGLARLPDVDFAAVARALGAEAATVQMRGDLRAIESWLARPEKPLVLDCKADPTIRGDW
jgi:thiamine pyrophosphate-dependent acetolactate synthase large subunit-like protein